MTHKHLWLSLTLPAFMLFSHAARSADFSTGFLVGYKGGMSYRAAGGVSGFARNFPLSVDFGLTFSMVDPGDPVAARRVFIANATNGTPEKNGTTWDFRMDLLYDLKVPGPKQLALYAGPRFSLFDAHFRYVGANEEFDIVSNQWGLGVGGRGMFSISNKVALTLTAGFDYYFNAVIEGHDTAYSPDDQNINPKEDFTYKDATTVVNVPKFQPTILVGFAYAF